MLRYARFTLTSLLTLTLLGFAAYIITPSLTGHDNLPAVPLLSASICPSRVDVYFSPTGGCTEAIVTALNGSQAEILIQAYTFTSAPIAQAVVAAHRRGVAVTVALDKSQLADHYSVATYFAHAGIPTFFDCQHPIAHSKVMVIDGHTVITGSFNFTKTANDSNLENLLIIDSPDLARLYRQNFSAHLAHSSPFNQ